jgi:uncharacterized protein
VSALDLRKLRLRAGEQFQATVAVELEPLELGGQAYVVEPANPAATVTVTRMTSGYVFRLELDVSIVGPCVRCLGGADVPVAVDVSEYHATSPESEELATPYLADGRLDVSGWARDAVALALPDRILCRDDCAGLCPACGKDLNSDPHVHEDDALDPRWADLARLRDSL